MTIRTDQAPAYFTICARNYLAYALVLRCSLLAVEPDASFTIFLTDGLTGEVEIDAGAMAIADLNIPEFQSMAFRYDVLELSTAVKPSCFLHLLQTAGHESAIYLDPDIQIFAPLTQVLDKMSSGHSCVLTPHILKPLMDDKSPGDTDILRSGSYNLGFAAFDGSTESLAFLRWWAERLAVNGYNDLSQGLFVDQKFVEMAPSFMPNLHILRDPGYNVAYWNLIHRPITRIGDEWFAAGQPLVFFHFSGVVPGSKDIFSKHQSRVSMTSVGAAAELVETYLDLLESFDQARWRSVSYAFGQFDDGSPILSAMRRNPDLEIPPSDWFKSSRRDYWNAPSEHVDQQSTRSITRLMLAIHDARPDLRAAFPLSSKAGREAYHTWFLTHGVKECGASPADLSAALNGRPVSAAAAPISFPGLRWLGRCLEALSPALARRVKAWLARRGM